MTDTLPDLRHTIAEGMEALAASVTGLLAGPIARDRLTRGAQTLRWCAEREAIDCEELKTTRDVLEDRIDELEDAIEDVSVLVTRQRPGGGRKPALTAAGFRDAIAQAVRDVRS